MLATLQQLGVMPSFSRPSVSNDNPYSESLFKPLKYRPKHPLKPFADVTEARQWVTGLVEWYNHEHRHSAIRFVTPTQRHEGLDENLLDNRKAVYGAARAKHPQRCSGEAHGIGKESKQFTLILIRPNQKMMTPRRGLFKTKKQRKF
ncbi:MAG: integrase core domain-containing protein [Methylobacter sp.]|jgi:hypothetical protein|nr:integrase core domain-containing protein [Methylobacter sp.]